MSDPARTIQPASAFSTKWYTMVAVAMGMFLGSIDGSIVNIALPTLERDLHTQFAIVQWVVLGYLLTVATLMLVVGRLADMIGKKPLYLGGFIVFTIGSGLCGLANSVQALIAFRVLQAVGAAMITALGTAIITEAFPAEERGRALGIGGLMISIGLISGPTLGGIYPWDLIMALDIFRQLTGRGDRYLDGDPICPGTRPHARERFDFPGGISLFASLLALLLALTLGQTEGYNAPAVIGLLCLFIVSLGCFVWIESHSPQPMIDFGLFKSWRFTVNLVTGFLTFICIAGTLLLMPFFLQNTLQLDPQKAGLLLSVVPLSMGIAAPVSGGLSDRFGPRPLTLLGLIMLLTGYLSVSTLTASISPLGYVLRFIPVGLGMGFFQSPNNSEIMGSVPRHRLGVASGLLALTRTIGQTSGIAVMGAYWAGRVSTLLGPAFSGDTTSAPAEIQVAALQQTVLVNAGIIGLALALSMWGIWREQKAAAFIRNQKTGAG